MKVMLVVLLAGLASAASNPKIVGGVETTIEDVPYQLEMEHAQLGLFWSFTCGSVIVGKNSVLTAGHCVEGVANKKNMRLRSGSTARGKGTIHEVESFVLHPQYKDLGGYADYDIAFITVSPPFTFSESTQPVALSQLEPVSGDDCLISGWGVTSETGSSPPANVRKVTVPFITREDCTADYSGEATITERMICAGLEQGGKDSCSGDSGGPVIVNGTLAGLVSWGYGCAEAGSPGVYTNVAYFLDWAQKQIDANESRL